MTLDEHKHIFSGRHLSGHQSAKNLTDWLACGALMICGELSAGLFFGHIPDDWQLPHLSLIGLEQQDHPDHEACQSDQRPDQNGQPAKKSNVSKEAQHNPQRSPCDGEKDRLERVKTDKATPVIRFDHQEDDRWNNGDVSQHARNVVGEPARRGLSRSSRRSPGAAACWTDGGTIWCLSATHGTKCHNDPPWHSFWNATRERAHVSRNEPPRQTKSRWSRQRVPADLSGLLPGVELLAWRRQC